MEDRFDALGPAGAILTALHEQPRSAWLVLGCDLPSLEIEDVERLLQLRNPFRVATRFAEPAGTQSHRDGSEMLPEPLHALRVLPGLAESAEPRAGMVPVPQGASPRTAWCSVNNVRRLTSWNPAAATSRSSTSTGTR